MPKHSKTKQPAKKQAVRKRGRPSKKTPEICELIVSRIANGEPLARICREIDVSVTTVWEWEQIDPDFSKRVARAREAGHDAIAERARETARGAGDSSGDIQRDKLIVDTDLKLLQCWNPRYSQKHDVAHSGQVGVTVTVKNYQFDD